MRINITPKQDSWCRYPRDGSVSLEAAEEDGCVAITFHGDNGDRKMVVSKRELLRAIQALGDGADER